MKKYRLFGNVGDLRYVSSNSTCDYYSLTLYVKLKDGYIFDHNKTGGFNGYSRRAIFQKLKAGIIADLKTFGIDAE